MIMKKTALFLILLCMAFLTFSGSLAEDATIAGMTFSTDAAEIDLGSAKVKYDDLTKFLDKFPNLTHVDMFGTVVGRSTVNKLADRYPNVTFGWTMRIGDDHTIRTDQTAFSTNHYSSSLSHEDADFEVLKYCTQLRALDLGHNFIHDLSFLDYMPELRVLIVACNYVKDITPIGRLTHLEYLEIFSNRIQDISCLTNLTNLMDLNLGHNAITDYSPLMEMTWLKRLWMINGSEFTKACDLDHNTIVAIKAALPNTVVDTSHEPSLGGWREHDHYTIIRKCFTEGVYYPFADSTGGE